MRPTSTEQLAAARRILGELVAPHVVGDYPAALLAGVIDALGVLERGWEDVPGFLVRDTARLRDLLETYASTLVDGQLGVELAAGIAAFLESRDPERTDLRALDAHHTRGRELLARVVPAVMGAGPGASSAASAAMRAYFADHVEDFPLRPAPRVPATEASVPANTASDAKGSRPC